MKKEKAKAKAAGAKEAPALPQKLTPPIKAALPPSAASPGSTPTASARPVASAPRGTNPVVPPATNPATKPAAAAPPAAPRSAAPVAPLATAKAGARSVPIKPIKLPPPTRPPAGLLEEETVDTDAYSTSFEFFSPTAREVWLCGSFNDWEPGTTAMKRSADGRWSVQVLLRPGRYEYRLVVDGNWQEDPMSRGFTPNEFGGLNSVVEVRAAS